MSASASGRATGRSGQIIVLFALVLTLVVFAVRPRHRRRQAPSPSGATSQNASDFAALAGARIIAHRSSTATPCNGTDANVRAGDHQRADRERRPGRSTFGAPSGPRYVDGQRRRSSAMLRSRACPPTAVGVTRSTPSAPGSHSSLGIIRRQPVDRDDRARQPRAASATGRPASRLALPGRHLAGVLPDVPVLLGARQRRSDRSLLPAAADAGQPQRPGGFGWLKFGCDGYGLGQEPPANAGGCGNDIPFLNEQIGPPANIRLLHAVGQPGSLDRIGSLPGNKVSADCSYCIDNEITVTVPIWDVAGGTGPNAWYHIVGFAGFQITECQGGKNLAGVWRKPFFQGPVSSTPAGPLEIQMLGVQLVH